jgi:lipoate---protein ligase
MRYATIHHSSSTDPWYNLALEEHLVARVSGSTAEGGEHILLYLWQNDNTVVIGRNQNAWNECRTGLLEEEGGRLARRSTGGGAVYHDLGNLNFSIITSKALYDIRRSLGLVVDAVRRAGIEAVLSGRNDILADDRKFSGNAFQLHRDAGLHHGTLLIHSDHERIARYLNVSRQKLESKGVRSVRSRVVNLDDLKPGITVEEMKTNLEEAFLAEYAPDVVDGPMNLSDLSDEVFARRLEKYRSWSWRYGETIAFTQTVEQQFAWGGMQLCVAVRSGRIEEARIYTDALDSDFFADLAAQLTGIRYTSKDLVETVRRMPDSDLLKGHSGADVRTDIAGWMAMLEF